MKIITAAEFDDTIREGLTLVDFFAEWCGPCKMLGPVLEQVDEERFGIMSIPAVYLFKDGEVLNKMIGFSDESGVKRFIDDAIA